MLGKWANFRLFDEGDLADIEEFLKKDEKDWSGQLIVFLIVVFHVFLDFLDKEEYERVKQMKYFDEIAKNALM